MFGSTLLLLDPSLSVVSIGVQIFTSVEWGLVIARVIVFVRNQMFHKLIYFFLFLLVSLFPSLPLLWTLVRLHYDF